MAERHYYIVPMDRKTRLPIGPAFHWFSVKVEQEPIGDLAVNVRFPFLLTLNDWVVVKTADNLFVPDIITDARSALVIDAWTPSAFWEDDKPPPPSGLPPRPPRMTPGPPTVPRPPAPPPPAPPAPPRPSPYPKYPFYPQSFSLYTPVASRFGNRTVAYFLGMWPKYEDWLRRPDDIDIWPIRGLIVAGKISQQPELRREIDYRWIYKERFNGRRDVPGGYIPLHFIDECYLLHRPSEKEYDNTRLCTYVGDSWTEFDSLRRMTWSKAPQFETPP